MSYSWSTWRRRSIRNRNISGTYICSLNVRRGNAAQTPRISYEPWALEIIRQSPSIWLVECRTSQLLIYITYFYDTCDALLYSRHQECPKVIQSSLYSAWAMLWEGSSEFYACSGLWKSTHMYWIQCRDTIHTLRNCYHAVDALLVDGGRRSIFTDY